MTFTTVVPENLVVCSEGVLQVRPNDLIGDFAGVYTKQSSSVEARVGCSEVWPTKQVVQSLCSEAESSGSAGGHVDPSNGSRSYICSRRHTGSSRFGCDRHAAGLSDAGYVI